MQNFVGIGRTGRLFHLFFLFHPIESGIAGRPGMAGIVVIDLDELWTLIPE